MGVEVKCLWVISIAQDILWHFYTVVRNFVWTWQVCLLTLQLKLLWFQITQQFLTPHFYSKKANRKETLKNPLETKEMFLDAWQSMTHRICFDFHLDTFNWFHFPNSLFEMTAILSVISSQCSSQHHIHSRLAHTGLRGDLLVLVGINFCFRYSVSLKLGRLDMTRDYYGELHIRVFL